jgi:hypothetical protein
LKSSNEEWKIFYFHHPLYSDGVKHGPALELRVLLEPILIRYGVDVVFSGHDHVYERLKPQSGITYFVTGAGGQEVRSLQPSAAEWDRGYSRTRALRQIGLSKHQSRRGPTSGADWEVPHPPNFSPRPPKIPRPGDSNPFGVSVEIGPFRFVSDIER